MPNRYSRIASLFSRRATLAAAALTCAACTATARAPEAAKPAVEPGGPAAAASQPCAMSAESDAWATRATDAWQLTLRQTLAMREEADAVTFVFFDGTCVFRGEGNIARRGEAHGGLVALPNGASIPPQVTSFAAPYDDNRRILMTMALPEIWRAAGVQSELTLETLMVAVFVHEMTHTRQFRAVVPLFDALERRWKLGDDLNDDVVQNRYRDTPEFVALIAAERELLFGAAAAATDAEARAKARETLAGIEARRARYFTGEDEKLADLEDIFLTMEGAAQWTAYRWLVNVDGGQFAADTVLPYLRRGGRQWSQDEGLALFLVIDRLLPGWTPRAFKDSPDTALKLLAEAVR